MSGIQAFFNAPTTCPGFGPREHHQAEAERLRGRQIGILSGTGGIGLDELPSIDGQIRLHESKRDLHAPAPPQACPIAPHLATALGPAADLTSGTFPNWMNSGF